MPCVLGIDTSNYTTSCALYRSEDNSITKLSKLLPVKEGERGIRQSDAVFHHTAQLHVLLEELLKDKNIRIDCVCASSVPRRQEGSYMPCFSVGAATARSISAALNVPCFDASHQQGHIMAALFSSGRLDLVSSEFLAFHISGGTTEAMIVTPHSEDILSCEICAKTLDLNAGQLVDRVGVYMGLSFPAGKEMERYALEYNGKPLRVKPSLKGADCCLSGFENKLTAMYKSPDDRAEVSALTLAYVEATVSAMAEKLVEKYGEISLVFAGGVMSNSIIRQSILNKFRADFAKPDFSCDNAAGVAIIGYQKYEKLMNFRG